MASDVEEDLLCVRTSEYRVTGIFGRGYDIPGPAPTPVLSAIAVKGWPDELGSMFVDSLASAAGGRAGPINWEARLEDEVDGCSERKASRGEGGTEFRSGAMALTSIKVWG